MYKRQWLICIGILGLLNACGPIPKPFQSAPATKISNPLLAIPDGAGVTVTPVEGANPNISGPLTEALVAALIAREIPATAGGALTNGLLLEGTAHWRDRKALVDWRLTDHLGNQVALIQAEVPATRTAYDQGYPLLVQELADTGADLVANSLRPDTTVLTEQTGPRSVAIMGVEGAPGDGNTALASAMTTVLDEAGVTIADSPEDATLLLAGSVLQGEPQNGSQEITIRWWLMDATGTVLGTLQQSNLVPEDSLNDKWGGAAYDATLANVQAIQEILGKIDTVRSVDPSVQ
ncbi:MAG TPA: hypothetical protein DCL95_18960 [Rhodospirillaceae bacterium]|nr:hypothetical protein [Rhodospirillaceae bacterium]MBB57631.1 hypothetical protein [Rhodospirillaceae bacterium]HAJ22106.1 hypothetical protein [Rhodospirillaceae bacterium]HBM13675.1 hypothetical protein [Rhodospirillaceae bacterium]